MLPRDHVHPGPTLRQATHLKTFQDDYEGRLFMRFKSDYLASLHDLYLVHLEPTVDGTDSWRTRRVVGLNFLKLNI
jgi:hypothetical protein